MKRLRIILLIIFLFVGIGVILFILMQRGVVFYKENSEELLAYLPLGAGERFTVIFVHSIHLTDVVEKYVVLSDGNIRQYEMIFSEFGIGMPSNAGAGERFVYEDGLYHIKDMDNVFPSLEIRNGKTVSEHRLEWNRDGVVHQVYFNEYFEPGSWFTLKYKKLSILQMWKGVEIVGKIES